MSDYQDQVPFANPELAENAEPRCPCLLLLDTLRINGRRTNQGIERWPN